MFRYMKYNVDHMVFRAIFMEKIMDNGCSKDEIDDNINLNPRTLSRHVTALIQWHSYQHFPDPIEAAYHE